MATKPDLSYERCVRLGGAALTPPAAQRGAAAGVKSGSWARLRAVLERSTIYIPQGVQLPETDETRPFMLCLESALASKLEPDTEEGGDQPEPVEGMAPVGMSMDAARRQEVADWYAGKDRRTDAERARDAEAAKFKLSGGRVGKRGA